VRIQGSEKPTKLEDLQHPNELYISFPMCYYSYLKGKATQNPTVISRSSASVPETTAKDLCSSRTVILKCFTFFWSFSEKESRILSDLATVRYTISTCIASLHRNL